MSDTRIQTATEIIMVVERIDSNRFVIKTKGDDKEQMATLRIGDTLTVTVPLYLTEVK